MTTSPKTIQVFLPSGDAHGIRFAEITTRIVQVIEVPRSLLSDFLAMEQSSQVGVYLLIGEDSEEGEQQVYVGQTGELRSRLATHNQKKDFWERALVLISKTNSLTQTHALFLEWHSLQQIRQAGRFSDENGNSGSRPYTPAPLEAECLEIFETGSILVSSLGFPLFDSVVSSSVQGTGPAIEDDCFLLQSPKKGIDARGIYTSEGFVVFADSSASHSNAPSIGQSIARARQKLLDTKVLVDNGEGQLIFKRDHLFTSPSSAATAVLGRNANGWTAWKDCQGRTLHEIKRETGSVDP